METHAKLRRYEVLVVFGLAAIFVTRRLFEAWNEFLELLYDARYREQLAETLIQHDLLAYDHLLNAVFPIVAGALLLLTAWMVVHYLAYPAVRGKASANKALVYLALSVLLVFAATFLFHYFREYVRFTRNYVIEGVWRTLEIDGFKVYSLFRKKAWVGDGCVVLILFGMYELLAQLSYFLANKASLNQSPDEEGPATLSIGHLFPLPFLGFGLFFAFRGQFPPTFLLDSVSWAILCGSVLVIAALQEVLHKGLKRNAKTGKLQVYASSFALFVFLCLCFNLPLAILGARLDSIGFTVFFVLCLSTSLAAATIAWLRKTFLSEQHSLQQKVSDTSAELAALRSQINPHFLFNALNSLYTSALKEGNDRTAAGIQQLGDMMRFILHENHRDQVSLAKEVEYLLNYIRLQRMRIDETQGVEIRVEIAEPGEERTIAPMLLITFVENAFKHGISLVQPSFIHITLVNAPMQLEFAVRNSVHGNRENDPEQEHTGIGIENMVKRLELIYPGRHELQIRMDEREYFARLVIRY